MIQDIHPHRFFNQYDTEIKPSPNSPVLIFNSGKILADTNGWLRIPSVGELDENTEFTFLFKVDANAYFLADSFEGELPGYEFTDIRQIREMKVGEKHQIFAIMTGKHLSDWYRDTRYCGRCGNRMVHSEKERAMTCPECGYTAYPRIMPAVIVGVTNGDKILITRYRNGYQHNALVAGFTEIGETLEETVAREVMEEAGLHVNNIRYYKSQPWGMANDILAGFFCDVCGDTEIHMDSEELKYAEWTAREDIVLQPDSSSLTNEMMMVFKEGKQFK
ncbi:MAG: NAD(+) diphosphatase [Oscillospiraceae bacterium]|nr:NAD(+) diphosphatase [Oscillospiraceae bacterium]